MQKLFYSTSWVVSFWLMALCIKENSSEASLSLIIFGRAGVSTLWLFILLKMDGDSFKSKDYKLLNVRCITGALSMWLSFYALSIISFAEAALLRQSSPIWVSLFAWFALKEKMSFLQRSLIAVGFFSTFLFFLPKINNIHPAMLCALGSGILSAVAYTTIRGLKNTDSSNLIAFYFSLYCSLSALPFFASWSFRSLSLKGYFLLIASGVFGTLAQIWMTKAYHLYPAAFNYGAPLLAALSGYLIYGENLHPIAWLGAFGLITSGVWFFFLRMPEDKFSQKKLA